MHLSFGVNLEVFGGVEVSGNIADHSGGGMYIYDSSARLHHDVTLTGNEAKGDGADGGGAIMLKFDSALELRDGVTIRGNSATNSGGGIGAEGSTIESSNRMVLDIRGNVSISNNVAAGGGGGIEISNANISISDHVAISNNQAGESGGAIRLTDSNIDIRNQVVIQGNDCQDQGGAIFATFSTIRLASDVAVIENSAQSDGGGICILDSGMNIEKNVSLSRNVAGGIGGAVLAALESTGGAIITMREGVNIVGNVALDGGGVYIEGGALMISDDVECRENTCTRDGGGICASISEVTLERGVRLTDNVAAGRGGSLLARQTNVIMRDNVDVSRNKATEGGGLVLEVNSSWSASENITFEENSAGENGGAVSANPGMSGCRMDLRDGVSFNRNTAGQSGGGLFLEQKARLFASGKIVFRGNAAVLRGGAIAAFLSCSLTFSGGTEVVGNDAADSGGGIALHNSSLRAGSLGPGGCYTNLNGSSMPTMVQLSENEVTSQSGRGGAIWGTAMSMIDLWDCVNVSSNTAMQEGGGIFLWADSEIVVRGAVSISRNRALVAGGISAVSRSSVTLLDGATVRDNKAVAKGGGLALEGSSIVTRGSKIVNNTAKKGGGICAEAQSKMVLSEETVLEGNSATLGGGGGLTIDESSFECRNSSISNNFGVRYGGGVHLSQHSRALLKDCVLHRNQVRCGCSDSVRCSDFVCGGGGIAAGGTAFVSLEHGTSLVGNTCEQSSQEQGYGGAILLYGRASMNINMSLLDSNRAGGDGGALGCLDQSILNISGTGLQNNHAGARGGAISASKGAAVSFSGTVLLLKNIAVKEGGGLFTEGLLVLAANGRTQLEANKAVIGGGLAVAGQKIRLMPGHVLLASRNTATRDGGATALLSGSVIQLISEGCHSNCESTMIGNGKCNPSCMSRGCLWDEGDCDAIFSSAGAGTQCSLEECHTSSNSSNGNEFNSANGNATNSSNSSAASVCGNGCFSAECAWGGEQCSETRSAIRECPFFDAVTFQSLKNSERELILPGLTGNMSETQLDAVLRDMVWANRRPDLAFAVYPGCGSTPLIMRDNQAGRNGGAIFFAPAANGPLDQGCAIEGLEAGINAVEMSGNSAGVAGGAMHHFTAGLSTVCRDAFKRQLSIPGSGQPISIAERAVHFSGNSAGKYGAAVSSEPLSVKWSTRIPTNFAPGQDSLKLSAVQLDWNNSEMKSLHSSVEFLVCHPSQKSCPDADTSPIRADKTSSELAWSTIVSVECKSTHIQVFALLIQSSSALGENVSAVVECTCRPGHSHTVVPARGTWWCKQCSTNHYVVDPNNPSHSCQPCPTGATCNGVGVTGKVSGSRWENDHSLGVTTLVSCPAGYAILNTRIPEEQMCFKCKAGMFCPGGAEPPIQCTAGTHSEAGSSDSTQCVEASFVEMRVALPMSKTEFDQADRQEQFKKSVADAAGVDVSQIVIVGYVQTSTRRGERALLAASIEVETKLVFPDANAAHAAAGGLNMDAINSKLVLNGLPEGSLISAPVVQTPSPSIDTMTLLALIAISLLAFLFAIALICTLRMRWARKISRALVGGKPGAAAQQVDLPYELRSKYEAFRLIGGGGSGTVLEAVFKLRGNVKQAGISRAVKLVHADSGRSRLEDHVIRRLRREAALLERVSSPNVVKLLESGPPFNPPPARPSSAQR